MGEDSDWLLGPWLWVGAWSGLSAWTWLVARDLVGGSWLDRAWDWAARVSVRGPAHGRGLGLGRLPRSWHMFRARSALVLYTDHFRRGLRNHYLEICLGICLHTIPAGRGGTYIVAVSQHTSNCALGGFPVQFRQFYLNSDQLLWAT